jgi:hypothetical protein
MNAGEEIASLFALFPTMWVVVESGGKVSVEK